MVEIKTTASMSHPHILPLFDSGSTDGFLFYVMPYIEGETLRDKLNRETQLGIDEAVRIARRAAGRRGARARRRAWCIREWIPLLRLARRRHDVPPGNAGDGPSGRRSRSLSSDGTRVAFYSERDGTYDLLWMPADRSAPAERVADGDDTRTGSTTFWTHDGAWILIDGMATGDARTDADLASRTMMSARPKLGPTVRVIERVPLFSAIPYFISAIGTVGFDVSRDGQRFLMLRRALATGGSSPPVVVLHWATEVERRMREQGGRAP